MREVLTNLLHALGLAWWVEILTENPRCTYYFGPFLGRKAAQAAQVGYLEDLEKEGAQGIIVSVRRCKPSKLTIFDDFAEGQANPKVTPTFSRQF